MVRGLPQKESAKIFSRREPRGSTGKGEANREPAKATGPNRGNGGAGDVALCKIMCCLPTGGGDRGDGDGFAAFQVSRPWEAATMSVGSFVPHPQGDSRGGVPSEGRLSAFAPLRLLRALEKGRGAPVQGARRTVPV